MEKKKTIAQQLGVRVTKFAFIIKNDEGQEIYFENSMGDWNRTEYNQNGKEIYFENSAGYWRKYEYDQNGNTMYYENSDGKIIDNRPKLELTMDEIAQKFNIPVSQLKIKK